MPKIQKRWTKEELLFLVQSRNGHVNYKELAKTLGRSEASIRQKFHMLGESKKKLPQHKYDRRCHVSIPCRFLDPIRPYAKQAGVSLARYIVTLINQHVKEKANEHMGRPNDRSTRTETDRTSAAG